jgi:DNA topoisomerase-3
MDCSVCFFELKLFEEKGAHKISVSKEECEACGSRKLAIVFNKGKSPMPDGSEEYTGCIVCDETLNNLTTGTYGKMFRKKTPGKGKKGKGKGKKGKKESKGDPRMSFDGF